MESSSPFWNQTFVYPGESLLQLKTKQLEITAWSHNRNLANEFLGEFMLDLSGEYEISYYTKCSRFKKINTKRLLIPLFA